MYSKINASGLESQWFYNGDNVTYDVDIMTNKQLWDSNLLKYIYLYYFYIPC